MTNGAPTEREFNLVIARLKKMEDEIDDLKSYKARAQGISAILGFIGGIVSAVIVSAIVRAIWGG